MQQAITDRVQKTRDQIRDWSNARIDELQEKREALVARKDETVEQLAARKDEVVDSISTRKDEVVETISTRRDEVVETISTRKDEAVDTARERLITMQATVLESAKDMLGWAGEQLGPRAEFVKKGEEALEEALVSLRAGHSATLPIDDFDSLSVKKATAALDATDVDGTGLRTLRAYEAANKNRKTMLAELDRRLEELEAATPAEAPAANEPTE